MLSQKMINIGLDNGLLPDGTKPFIEPKGNSTRNVRRSNHCNAFEKYTF